MNEILFIAWYIYIKPGIELNKLPAHFNEQIKNEKINIIYLIIKGTSLIRKNLNLI